MKLHPSIRSTVLVLAVAGSTVDPATGQDADSLRHYDLDEIVVRSDAERTNSATLQRISINELARTNAGTVDGFAKLIPGAHVQTNSRGETLVYLRGAGERQVAVFFAGALLNVPWDNRVDLSMVPGGAIGAIEVSKGPSSILYGTNVIGGAVNLVPRTLDHPGQASEISASLGSEGTRLVAASHLARHGPWQYGAAVDYSRRDGVSVPADADTPFNQPSGEVRTNTDRELTGLYATVGRAIGRGAQVAATVMHNVGTKGVAPESHVADPADARFWRYPNLHRTYGIATLTAETGRGRLAVSGWLSSFGQDIDQYEDGAYATLSEQQEDDDRAAGTRVSYRRSFTDAFAVLLATNYLYSTHKQANTDVATGASSTKTYRQDIFSLGSELSFKMGSQSQITAGGSIDGYVAPEAAAEARTSAVRLGTAVGFSHEFDDTWHTRVSAGRKVRFPTTRELLDTGLDRFILNPGLGPEQSVLAEAAVGISGPLLSAEVIPFASWTNDTIDQTRVQVDGQSFRQRVNIEGSTVFGVEVAGSLRPHPRVGVDFTGTLTHARGRLDGITIRLTERPASLATIGVSARTRNGVSVFAQAVHQGRAFGQVEDGSLTALPSTVVANVRLAYLAREPQTGLILEVFGRIDNILDAVTIPQPGLPGPGRMIRFGVTVSR